MNKLKSAFDILEYQENLPDHIQRVNEQGNPETITVNGQPKAVVVDIRSWQELLQQMDRAEAVAGIREGMEDIKQGNVVSLEDFLMHFHVAFVPLLCVPEGQNAF